MFICVPALAGGTGLRARLEAHARNAGAWESSGLFPCRNGAGLTALHRHRAVATRFDKRDFVWRGTVDVASIRIWLRNPSHDLQDTL
jgi:hypothetical protein